MPGVDALNHHPGEVRLDIDPNWKDLKERLDPVLKGLRDGLSNVAARTVAAAANSGFALAGVQGTKVLLGLNLEEFCRDVVVRMVEQKNEVSVAKLELYAITKSGAAQLVQQLSVALLCSGHVRHAAAVTIAFVEECEDAGMSPMTAAACVAPAVIAAVDDGHGHEVAMVQKIMVDNGHKEEVVCMTVYIARDMGRPDVVAIGTLDAIEAVEGGEDMAAGVAAAAMMKGFHDEVAAAAVNMNRLVSNNRNDCVIKVVAAAAVQGVESNRPSDVVKVSAAMAARGGRHVVSRSMRYMAHHNHAWKAAVVSSTAIQTGYLVLTAQLIGDVILSGYLYAFFTIGFLCIVHLLLYGLVDSLVAYSTSNRIWRLKNRSTGVPCHPLDGKGLKKARKK